MRPYHVAIVGSGPSGYFAAASLLKFADSTRPDDRSTCASTCSRCCRRRGVWCAPAWRPTIPRSSRSARSSRRPRPIRVSGSSATSWSASMCRPTELAEHYDAVIYAVGAQSDRPLGIPGEDLPGSVAAVDFVGWYNAHPHFEEMTPDLSTGRARRRRQRQRGTRRGAHPGQRSRRAGATPTSPTTRWSRCTRGASRRWWSSGAAARCRPRSPRWSCANSATSRRWPTWT